MQASVYEITIKSIHSLPVCSAVTSRYSADEVFVFVVVIVAACNANDNDGTKLLTATLVLFV